MPVLTGTSVRSLQNVITFAALTVAQYELVIPAVPTGGPLRIGYGYLFVVQSTTPFQRVLLDRRPIYSPGTYVLFPANYGFSSVRYTLIVDWNNSGVPWRVTYA